VLLAPPIVVQLAELSPLVPEFWAQNEEACNYDEDSFVG
jgi:hypothetical protein